MSAGEPARNAVEKLSFGEPETHGAQLTLHLVRERKRCHMDSLGKTLVVAGLLIAAIGLVMWLLPGRGGGGLLPGDIVVERKSFRFYFPLVTCLVISVVLSLIAWLFRR